jgi:xanthine dehydrogenase molybdenum-binding subunit
MSRTLETAGKFTPRIDALERVTGQAQYTEDVFLSGMLFARVLRSHLPHARVRSIDTSAAEALPGVMAILHSKNTDLVWSGGDLHGRRRLFAETARFVGDAVAAVAAVDRHTAEEALALIRVDYEPLPPVLTIQDAMKEGAPKIHPEGNVDKQVLLYGYGNIEEGLRQAEFIYEGDFVTKHQNNAQLERRVSLAHWEGDSLTVWTATQGIFSCRRDIAQDLNLPLNKVRVICRYLGGGFGNKNQGYDFDLMAALLSRQTRRPVRVEYNRHEDFIAVHGRWATQQHYRIGYQKDGTITSLHLKAYSNMGGYLRSSRALAPKFYTDALAGGTRTDGFINGPANYAAANMRSEIYRVHTNTSCSANFRPPGGPQGGFAIESAMDEIAERLGMDPVEFRLKNVVKDLWEGNTPLTSNGLAECMQRGAETIGWKEKRREYASQKGPLRRGVGMSIGSELAHWGPGVGSSAEIKIFPDGSVKLLVGVVDIGGGAKTTLGLIAAEALGVPLESISIEWGDTDLTSYAPGESASRTTVYTGNAVIQAAKKVREQLLAQASVRLKVRREDLDLRGGKIIRLPAPSQSWPIAEVTSGSIDAISSLVTVDPEETHKARVSFVANFAEVEVNLATGKIRVLRYVAAHDSGTIINKLTATSQVKGGVTQGIGMALREELIWDRRTGVPVNHFYLGAKPMLHPEAPDVEVIFVETDEPYGPFGAKQLGEVPPNPVIGAMANAVYHATGVRIRELPLTPDKLLNALRKREAETPQGAG